MERLLELITRELERPRTLPPQVARHLEATYGTGREEVGLFLEGRLEQLEDYEVDLILSPVFTPTLTDQALFAPVLGGQAWSEDAIAGLIQRIAARPTVARLAAEDAVDHPVRLREVTIERYVRRLRLEGSIPEALRQALAGNVPPGDQPLVLAVARRAVWNHPGRRELLGLFLERVTPDQFATGDVTTLLRLAETYEPAGLTDFLGRLPGWIEGMRREASTAASPKPFFNERVEDLHGGGRDQRRGADPRAVQRAAELQSMLRLQQLLTGAR